VDPHVKRGHRIHLTFQLQPPWLIQTILMEVEKQQVTTAAILIMMAKDSGATQRIPARDMTIVTFPSALVCVPRLSRCTETNKKSNVFWFSSTNDVSILKTDRNSIAVSSSEQFFLLACLLMCRSSIFSYDSSPLED